MELLVIQMDRGRVPELNKWTPKNADNVVWLRKGKKPFGVDVSLKGKRITRQAPSLTLCPWGI